MKDFIGKALSENGEPSSKRVIGCVSYVVSIFCIVWLLKSDGGSDIVKDLLQTLLISASGLLGISSIASAMSGGGNASANG